MLLKDLAEKLGCRLEGDGPLEIRRVAGLDQAGPGDVTFFTNPKYAAALRRTRASAVIASDDTPSAGCAMLRTKDPYLTFANALSLFMDAPQPVRGVDRLGSVADDATLGRHVSLGPFVTV